jgi:hypothetical protein
VKKIPAALVGFFAASLVPAILFAVFSPVAQLSDIAATFGWLVFFYFFSAVAVLLLGVPAFLLLNRLGWVRWWSVLVTGLAGGAVVGFMVRWPNTQTNDLIVMGGAGMAAALAFWLIWRACAASERP